MAEIQTSLEVTVGIVEINPWHLAGPRFRQRAEGIVERFLQRNVQIMVSSCLVSCRRCFRQNLDRAIQPPHCVGFDSFIFNTQSLLRFITLRVMNLLPRKFAA